MAGQNLLSDILSDPQVKSCFLALVNSSLSAEEKYKQFSAFLTSREVSYRRGTADENRPVRDGKPPENPRKRSLPCDLEDVLIQTAGSVRRALQRMKRSQHQDGGWGSQIEQSSLWHTAYSVLFLNSARMVEGFKFNPAVDDMIRRGVAYLELHPEDWCVEMLPSAGAVPVYDLSVMVRCFYSVGRTFMRRESALRVYRSLEKLLCAQNEDGGWDAKIWGCAVNTPTGVWSEVGATSAALQALAETRDERVRESMERGIHWLINTQNPDGSWNNGSCDPLYPGLQLNGVPVISKTCDALVGIQAGSALDIPLQPYQECIDRSVAWLIDQEKVTLDRQKRTAGSSWGFIPADYENICMVLETFIRMSDVPASLLAQNAAWLIQGQRRQAYDPEDGRWMIGDTARTGLALADFYRREKGL